MLTLTRLCPEQLTRVHVERVESDYEKYNTLDRNKFDAVSPDWDEVPPVTSLRKTPQILGQEIPRVANNSFCSV